MLFGFNTSIRGILGICQWRDGIYYARIVLDCPISCSSHHLTPQRAGFKDTASKDAVYIHLINVLTELLLMFWKNYLSRVIQQKNDISQVHLSGNTLFSEVGDEGGKQNMKQHRKQGTYLP